MGGIGRYLSDGLNDENDACSWVMILFSVPPGQIVTRIHSCIQKKIRGFTIIKKKSVIYTT